MQIVQATPLSRHYANIYIYIMDAYYIKLLRQNKPSAIVPIKTVPFHTISSSIYSSIPETLHNELLRISATTVANTIEWSIFNVPVVLTIVCIHRETKETIDNIIRCVHHWLHFVLPYSPPMCTTAGLHVLFFLFHHVKRLPHSPMQSIDRIHANTAYTTSCPHTSTNNTIVVYRKEEWLRAFLHETFHYLGLDFSHSPYANEASRILLRELWTGLSPHLELRVYESFCDAWAVLFQIWMHAANVTSSRSSIRREVDHSLFQCAKVLTHCNISLNDFRRGNQHYRENTPVLSYFVLKSVALYFWREFIGLFDGSFCFPPTRPAIRKYVDFLMRGLQDEHYTNAVSRATERVKRLQGTDSLRMSIYELKN